MPDDQQTSRTVRTLRDQAARCRRLADAITDRVVSRNLFDLALEFEERANEIETALQPAPAGR